MSSQTNSAGLVKTLINRPASLNLLRRGSDHSHRNTAVLSFEVTSAQSYLGHSDARALRPFDEDRRE